TVQTYRLTPLLRRHGAAPYTAGPAMSTLLTPLWTFGVTAGAEFVHLDNARPASRGPHGHPLGTIETSGVPERELSRTFPGAGPNRNSCGVGGSRVSDCPGAARPPSGVALDDAVGDEVERGALGLGQAGEQLLGPGDEVECLGARVMERVGLRDPRADRRGILGRADRVQVERAQAPVTAAGKDQRQRDGAVEQIGAPRLAGPLRRA